MFRMQRHRECPEKRKYFSPILEIPASKFTHDEPMTDNVTVIQQGFKPGSPIP
jgi:hypothetical protein